MAVTLSTGENDDEKKRKPYAPPVIVSREPLEAMAGTCTPVPPAKANAGQCRFGPISS